MTEKTRLVEAELLDVALGKADPALVSRVESGAGFGEAEMLLYAEWMAVCADIREQAALGSDAAARVARGVMGRLDEARTDTPAVYAKDAPSSGVRAWIERVGVAVQGALYERPRFVAAVCGMVALIASSAAGALYWRNMNSVVVEQVAGAVLLIDDASGAGSAPVRLGARIAMPAHLDVGAEAAVSLRLPHGARISTVAAPLDVYVSNSRLVRQNSGSIHYRVEHGGRGLAPFTVAAPQGRVVDLGTEFEVNAAEPQATVVRVDAGKVRVEPNHGAGLEAASGERAILTDTRAVTEVIEPRVKPVASEAAKTTKSTLPDEAHVAYRPQEKVMGLADPLRVFMRPRVVSMASEAPAILKKMPPFTSEHPMIGVVQSSVDGRQVSAAIACDQKLNGKTRIYLDSNLNGDLTDDPAFTEGEDFKPGQFFAAGLLGHNDALWIRRPVRVDSTSTPPKVEEIADQVEYVNRIYLSGDVAIPLSAEDGAKPQAAKPQSVYLLLDVNSDGSYVDDDGSLGIWTQIDSNAGAPILLNASAPSKPAAYMGYKWTLLRELSGGYALTGRRVNELKPQNVIQAGKPWVVREATTVDGRTIALGAPAKGYLLIYVWSTWYSSCQRDVPYDFNDLYPRFKDRGLAMVGISTDYRRDDLTEYVRSHAIQFPQLYNGPDFSEGIVADIGVDRSPLAILVDAGGSVVSVGKGADELWTYLDAHLPKKQ